MGEVVAGSIEVLSERLPAGLPLAGAQRARAANGADRARTVLAIDRATRAQAATALRAEAPAAEATAVTSASASASGSASQVAAPVPPPPPQASVTAASVSEPPCDEPIRTRSMARLLAKQGHPQRALAILEYLQARSDDPDLRPEIEALRAQIATT